jgi:hypothetical protein
VAFLYITEVFDRVWHKGLLVKIKRTHPPGYFKLMKACLHKREFEVKADMVSKRFPIYSRFMQGSVLGPMLYVLYILDLPVSTGLTVGTFTDDTAMMAVHEEPILASGKLSEYLTLLEEWLHKWKIAVNGMKSCNVTFTPRKEKCPAVKINRRNADDISEISPRFTSGQ